MRNMKLSDAVFRSRKKVYQRGKRKTDKKVRFGAVVRKELKL